MDMTIDPAMMQKRTDIPADPARRRLWIIAELRLLGSSLTEVARDLRVTPQAVSNALRVPSGRIEKALAERLGMPVQHLFPERYRADGMRLHRCRGAVAEAA